MRVKANHKTSCAAVAALCGLAALAWQSLTVKYNYQGDWSGLFATGMQVAMPPELAFEEVHRFRNDPGYDGQFYHVIAHDAFFGNGFVKYVDNPRLRWRRILIPGLAYVLALGQAEYIDFNLIGVNLAFVILGAYWLSRYCGHYGFHPGWGLLFGLTPAVMVSLDRLTVDTALAAFCVGFGLYGAAAPSVRIYPVLAAAPLARETGVVLIAAWCVHRLLKRDWKRAAAGVMMALPALGWLAFVHSRIAADHTVFASPWPLWGLLARTLQPAQYSIHTDWLLKAAVLDYLAVLGIWAALLLALRLVRGGKPGLLEITIWLFAGIFVVFLQQPQAWAEAYSFGRTMSPLLICLALLAVATRFWWNLLPLAMVGPRILFQLGPQWKGILRGLWAS